jgi:hypothetical protein
MECAFPFGLPWPHVVQAALYARTLHRRMGGPYRGGQRFGKAAGVILAGYGLWMLVVNRLT